MAHSPATFFLCMMLTGCNSFYPPWNQPRDYPISTQNINNNHATIITMTDEERAVIIVPEAVNGIHGDLRICPEPPPDAASDVANAFKAQLESESNLPEAQQKTAMQMSRESSSVLSAILERTQGLELFRDGVNALCVAWINDIYNTGDLEAWRQDFRYLLNLSFELINKEILPGNVQPERKNSNKNADNL